MLKYKIILLLIISFLLVFQISCFELLLDLEKISKSIAYQDNDDYTDNDYYYIYKYKNGEYNDEMNIIYQTGNEFNDSQIVYISHENNLNLYINTFSNDDCFSSEINTFLYCKENLMRHFYGSFNIYKTINELYSNNQISEKIYGQEYTGNNKDKLKIYLGDISQMGQGKYSYKCNTNKENNCLLNYISFIINSDNKENQEIEQIKNIEINSYAQINIGYPNIKGAYDEGKKLFDFLLNLPSFKEKCYITTSKSITIEDEYIKMICNSDTNIYDLPKIVFSFGEDNQIQLLLTSELLFYKQYDVYGERFFYVSRIEFSKLNKKWIIGKPLLNDANLIYDLEGKYIQFIFDEKNDFNMINFPSNSSSSFKKVIIIFFEVIGIFLLIFIVLFAIFYCHKRSKTLKMKEFISSKVQKLNDI